MTVASTNLKDIYDGDGVTRDWPITFPVDGLTEADIEFYVTNAAGLSTLVTNGVEVDLTTPKVTYPTVASGLDLLTSSEKAVNLRALPLTQEQIDVDVQGAIPLISIETALDRLTMITQQLNEEIERCVKVDLTGDDPDELIDAITDAVNDAEASAAAAAASEAAAAASAVDAAAEVVNCQTEVANCQAEVVNCQDQVTLAAAQVTLAEAEADDAAVSAAAAAASAVSVSSGAIQAEFYGGGAAITAGNIIYIPIPFACTITAAKVFTDQSCTAVVDVWKDIEANYPPTDADSITASAPPTVTADTNSSDETLTGWTKAVSAGDVLAFNVDSNDNAEFISVSLNITRS